MVRFNHQEFGDLPGLVNIQKAIENGPVEIVDFPVNSKMVIFHSFLLTFTRPGFTNQKCR